MGTEGAAWRLTDEPSETLEDALTEQLVAYNKARSAAIVERFEPGNLRARPVHAYVVGDDAGLLGGCVGRIEQVWRWLTIDTMWVHADLRGRGLGRTLLASVEEQARQRGCRWSDVTTFDFQAPDFYRAAGYGVYGVKADYPPGHSNYFLRKEL
jgi:GNAT superfamily N-acetyltransferase